METITYCARAGGRVAVDTDWIYCTSNIEVRYMRTDHTWAVEGSDLVALTSGHPAHKKWNITCDTRKVHTNGHTTTNTRCKDNLESKNRHAWHDARRDMRKMQRYAREIIEDSNIRRVKVAKLRLSEGLYGINVQIAICNDGTIPFVFQVEGYSSH